MWSRNGRPVATVTRPRPSRATVAMSLVSLLLRVTRAFLLLKANLDRMRMRAQPFEPGQPQRGIAECPHVLASKGQHAGPFEEGVHAERRPPSRGSGGGQGVIGPGHVVAERHGR